MYYAYQFGIRLQYGVLYPPWLDMSRKRQRPARQKSPRQQNASRTESETLRCNQSAQDTRTAGRMPALPGYLIRETKPTLPVLFGEVWLKLPVNVQRTFVTLRS